MTQLKEIYKCKICGNIVEVLHEGVGELVCCNEPMELQQAKTEDASTEKHVPYIEETSEGILVKIGQNQDHPMTAEHYIEWIELTADGVSYRQFLSSKDKPQALFKIKGKQFSAREYCNIHGLWTA